jgi:predicted nucleic acid-binding protein
MSKVSRLLTVDASVLRAAGSKEGHSAHCAASLNKILDICHRAVFNQEMKLEWDKHQSRFAAKWRGSMNARKKLIKINLDVKLQEVCMRIEAAPKITVEGSKALIKDAHILASALLSNHVVITGDQKLKQYWEQGMGPNDIEWLLVSQDDTPSQRANLMKRLMEINKGNPHPPLPL